VRRGLDVHAWSLGVGSPHAGGVEQHRGVLMAAATIGALGIALPLVLAGDHAFAATPYSVLGGPCPRWRWPDVQGDDFGRTLLSGAIRGAEEPMCGSQPRTEARVGW